jgi:Ca-activated chloride channel family protein
MYSFYSPAFFVLLLPLIYVFFKKYPKKSIDIPSISIYSVNMKIKFQNYIGKILIFISLLLMIFALARPVKIDKLSKVEKEGVDIVLALDISLSMLQEDMLPNRLETAKEVIENFVDKRKNDRLALVVFAGNAYTRVPLTFDHMVLSKNLEELSVKDIGQNNFTAIGLGIGSAINRLRKSETDSKVIILLTDGENNAGELSPMNAADIASNLGIKVYTIGLEGDYVKTFFGKQKRTRSEVDEGLLQEISKVTNGKYYKAKDKDTLQDIFEDIDSLEKSKIEAKEIQNKKELYRYFLIPSLLFFLLGSYFQRYKYITIP